jgi:hypothetical protein
MITISLTTKQLEALDNTLPWDDEGWRILPSGFLRVNLKQQKTKSMITISLTTKQLEALVGLLVIICMTPSLRKSLAHLTSSSLYDELLDTISSQSSAKK